MEELSSTLSFKVRTTRIASVVEAMAVDTFLTAAKSLICFLILTGSLMTDINHSVLTKLTTMDGRFPFDDLSKGKHAYLKNKDASDTDQDEDEEDDDDANDQDDEGGDEDFSGEEGGEEADPENEPEANGAGGSDGDEDNDDDGDDEDDGEDEEEEEDEDEEEEEDEEEAPQPPAKKRK
ncbi:uncharacterized protein LOC133295933 [Gastrolobium bilobum]|uniref:uncharacterized protein LOC133295933 n=1 Tax=Gastrolobium bilobum TaxID=150636 RepID=UPI002AB0DCBA|nr:uncharacterized protein LOC133295933 [Gastrolobium bilobum]